MRKEEVSSLFEIREDDNGSENYSYFANWIVKCTNRNKLRWFVETQITDCDSNNEIVLFFLVYVPISNVSFSSARGEIFLLIVMKQFYYRRFCWFFEPKLFMNSIKDCDAWEV